MHTDVGNYRTAWGLLILLSFFSHFRVNAPIILNWNCEHLGDISYGRDGSVSVYAHNQNISYEISYACLPNGINPPTTTLAPPSPPTTTLAPSSPPTTTLAPPACEDDWPQKKCKKCNKKKCKKSEKCKMNCKKTCNLC